MTQSDAETGVITDQTLQQLQSVLYAADPGQIAHLLGDIMLGAPTDSVSLKLVVDNSK